MIIYKGELADLKRNKSPEIINRIIHEAKRWENLKKRGSGCYSNVISCGRLLRNSAKSE